MWLKAVITPETGPGLHSSHMSMKTNSRVLRHTHVSSEMCYFYVIILFFFNQQNLLFSDFINLLDNYESSTGVSETVTAEELQENRLFIDAIMETDLMKVHKQHY